MPTRSRQPQVLAMNMPAELQVAATNGSIVTDSRGKKYIDFLMGWCVGNCGWRPPAIAKRQTPTPSSDLGGRDGVPPPPECLHELGRSLSIAEDVSGDDGQLQTSVIQRVSIRSRAPSAS